MFMMSLTSFKHVIDFFSSWHSFNFDTLLNHADALCAHRQKFKHNKTTQIILFELLSLQQCDNFNSMRSRTKQGGLLPQSNHALLPLLPKACTGKTCLILSKEGQANQALLILCLCLRAITYTIDGKVTWHNGLWTVWAGAKIFHIRR